MIPAGFDYHAPTTLDEAVQLLSDAGEDAKVLAGGQSLIPVLRLRLAAPETVIDLDRVDELRGIRLDGDTLVIGAMTPHHEVATDELVRQHARVLAEAAIRGAAQVKNNPPDSDQRGVGGADPRRS